jgi:hypothetical protein
VNRAPARIGAKRKAVKVERTKISSRNDGVEVDHSLLVPIYSSFTIGSRSRSGVEWGPGREKLSLLYGTS